MAADGTEILGSWGHDAWGLTIAGDDRGADREYEPPDCANALLIAAAPDLLDALGSCIWVLNNLHNAETEQFRMFGVAALTDARAALAKAKGTTDERSTA